MAEILKPVRNSFPADIFVSGSDNQPYRLLSLSQKRFVECGSLDGALRKSKGKYVENRQVVYADLEVSETFVRAKVSDNSLSGSRNLHFLMNPCHSAHTQV